MKVIKLFYSNAYGCVTNNGSLSPFFSIQRGVLQGCPLSANPPKSTINIMYSFIWDSKPDKIKRRTLIQNYEKGGLK